MIVNVVGVQKIVKQNLLGSQKCYLSVGVVSLQLFVIMIESLIHLISLIFVGIFVANW